MTKNWYVKLRFIPKTVNMTIDDAWWNFIKINANKIVFYFSCSTHAIQFFFFFGTKKGNSWFLFLSSYNLNPNISKIS